MQDKFRIVFYENTTSQISDMTIAFLKKFSKQLLDKGILEVVPPKSVSMENVIHSRKKN